MADAGSSVPEAARAAARRAGLRPARLWMADRIDAALEAAAPFIVAAASVELQQEVDRLSAECEALRGTVAEERATTGRRDADRERYIKTLVKERDAAERKVRAVETVTCWTNEDGKRFMFVDDVAVALEIPGALA